MTDEQPRRGPPLSELARYLWTETVGGMVLLAVTAVALVWANSPWSDTYQAARDFRIGPPGLHLNLTVGQWATDGLLAMFFFVAGLELKRELTVGELSHLKTAVLPVIAAVGGVVVPALVAAIIIGGAQVPNTRWRSRWPPTSHFALADSAREAPAVPAGRRPHQQPQSGGATWSPAAGSRLSRAPSSPCGPRPSAPPAADLHGFFNRPGPVASSPTARVTAWSHPRGYERRPSRHQPVS